jgi:DNA-binding transcriptional MerR regulator
MRTPTGAPRRAGTTRRALRPDVVDRARGPRYRENTIPTNRPVPHANPTGASEGLGVEGRTMSDSTSDSGRYDLGLLFTDGLPEMDASAGYRGAVAARAAGITYRQLDYWARTGLVEPTVRGASGSGTQRLYGFRDILVLKLVKRLLDTGISLQQIRTAVNQLRESGVVDLAQTTLMSDGASVYLCTSNDEVIDLVSRGQGVFGIAVGKVLREVEHSLVEIDTQTVDPTDELAARRAVKAS